MTIDVRTIAYEADGLALEGVLATPAGAGKRPAVLIAHEGPGLDDVQRDRARVYAELGYVAFALDYHGALAPFVERTAMMQRIGALIEDPLRTRRYGLAALEVLRAQESVDIDRIAATGYCFGGTVAMELARSGAEIRAVVGFHPGLYSRRPEDSRNIRGRVLMCIGGSDPLITREDRSRFEDEMTTAGVDWTVHLYGGVEHSFTHPRASLAGIPGIAYDARADAASWQSMKDLLADVFAH